MYFLSGSSGNFGGVKEDFLAELENAVVGVPVFCQQARILAERIGYDAESETRAVCDVASENVLYVLRNKDAAILAYNSNMPKVLSDLRSTLSIVDNATTDHMRILRDQVATIEAKKRAGVSEAQAKKEAEKVVVASAETKQEQIAVGLSKGTKIAIGVGAGIMGLMLLGLIVAAARR